MEIKKHIKRFFKKDVKTDQAFDCMFRFLVEKYRNKYGKAPEKVILPKCYWETIMGFELPEPIENYDNLDGKLYGIDTEFVDEFKIELF